MVMRSERISAFRGTVAARASGAADAALAWRSGIRGESHGRSQNDQNQGRQRE